MDEVLRSMQVARLTDAFQALEEARVALEFAGRKYRVPKLGTADYGTTGPWVDTAAYHLEQAAEAMDKQFRELTE